MNRKYYFHCSNRLWCFSEHGSKDYDHQNKLFSEVEKILESKYKRGLLHFKKEINEEPPLCLQMVGTLVLFKFKNQKGEEKNFFKTEVAGTEVHYENNQEEILICLKWFLNNISIDAESIADWFNKEWVYTG